jgi:carbamoyl-phosphate synthase (ammonia)
MLRVCVYAGFAVDPASLGEDWTELFVNANDGTNEGIMHKSRPYFTAQFHPEARGGPVDTGFLFDVFLGAVKEHSSTGVVKAIAMERPPEHERPTVKKVLLLGSGGLSIGQAGEFDYSGSQAIKALKEERISVVLMNPNIASVQTNLTASAANAQADSVYFLPVTPEFVEMVIKRERPDGIMVSMGGQTALNCGVTLEDSGVLAKYGVKVLGTSIDAIKNTEDRDIFAEKLREINEKLAPSFAVKSVSDALKAATKIGYPVMIRSAYSLGGLGSGICADESELTDLASKAFATAPQILVEKSLKGWKEVEYEVVRDAADNCITVCNMENFDPLGVHTGDSIVIAPSQTLSNEEYHMLRETAIKVIRHVGIVGECNIQYALDPHSLDYCIIEVNARLSRSSALASKATGYPLAAVAAKLALGVTLPEIKNAVTKQTSACFEPSLDYIVTKIPRWDLAKFSGVNQEIGSAMKSVGEVMAIGRTFEESFQKAMRMVDPSIDGFTPRGDWTDQDKLLKEITRPTDKRPAALAWALRNRSHSVDELHELSKIDRWFLARLARINQASERVQGKLSASTALLGESSTPLEVSESALANISAEEMGLLKRLGFSDKQLSSLLRVERDALASTETELTAWQSEAEIAALEGVSEQDVRNRRKALGVLPVTKQIDTLAAEYPAMTNYLYMTYAGSESDVVQEEGGVMVLGSGTYRIGSSVEFDWCSVSAIRTLRQLGEKTIVVNYNPETVSTDYDESNRLYFEELSKERVLDIYEAEAARGVIVSVGGQIPNNLALPLHRAGVHVLGTNPEMIDSAEDRKKFSQLMDAAGVHQPKWRELTTMAEAKAFAGAVGFPVLVRPSYVLSGAAMSVAFDDAELKRILTNAASVSPEHPVVITKFHENALEIEFDGVAKDGDILVHAISEHVEKAGVHSGDATLVLPPQTLSKYYKAQVRSIAQRVAKALAITGPFNMQLLADGADVLVIECNLRASRSFPFVSKTYGVDFISVATRAMLDADLHDLDKVHPPRGFVGIKSPMFSFTRLRGADPVLGVEMASTGEVACFGADMHEAFLKSMLASNFRIPNKAILVSAPASVHHDMVHSLFKLQLLGFQIYATDETHKFLSEHGFHPSLLPLPTSSEKPSQSAVVKAIQDRCVDLVVSIPSRKPLNPTGEYVVRRAATDFNAPLITNVQLLTTLADALEKHSRSPMAALVPETLSEYYNKEKPSEAWTDPHEYH